MFQLTAMILLASGVLATQALAEPKTNPDDCSYSPALLRAADFLFEEPTAKPPIWRDRLGDDAAYFRIRYGSMSYEDGIAMLRNLKARDQPPVRIDEILYAYSKPSDRAKLTAISPNDIGVSGWRALLLTEGIEAFIAKLKNSNLASEPIAFGLADLDDADKLQYAARAEEAGLTRLGLDLLSTADDLHPLVEMLNRQAAPKSERDRTITSAIYNSLFDPSFDISAQPEEVRAVAVQKAYLVVLQQIAQLISKAPQAGTLMLIYNQTGDDRIGLLVAPSLYMDVAQRRLDPAQEPDEFVSAMVERLTLVFDWRELVTSFANISAPGLSGEKISDMANEALAREALGPFIRDGKVSSLPDLPRSIGRDFPWDKWVSVALDLKADRSLATEDALIVANLLVATDRYEDAIAVLKRDSSVAAMREAHAIMRMLDRRCSSLLSPPMPLADTIYRFDD